MYFEGEALNETDTVIEELPEEERGQFILAPERAEGGIPVFNFKLTLKKVAGSKERLAALDACAGKYDMSLPYRPPNEVVTVRHEEQRLFLDLPGDATVELKPQGQDDFLATSIDCRLEFNRNDDGSVNSVTLPLDILGGKVFSGIPVLGTGNHPSGPAAADDPPPAQADRTGLGLPSSAIAPSDSEPVGWRPRRGCAL